MRKDELARIYYSKFHLHLHETNIQQNYVSPIKQMFLH